MSTRAVQQRMPAGTGGPALGPLAAQIGALAAIGRKWLAALLLAAAVIGAAPVAPPVAPPVLADEADPFVIFKPIEQKAGDRQAYWEAQLRGAPGPDDATKTAIITALADYESNPSAKTALGVLQHFSTFAEHKDFRFAAFGKDGGTYRNIDVFLSLDALKYELVIKTNEKLNAVRSKTGRAPIAYFLRVGSSGQRYLQWIEWAKAGKALDGMPADPEYILNKLFYSDDDVTNVAHPDAEARDPVVNEELNGNSAIAAFLQASGELGLAIDPRQLKTEFLSPTKAYGHLKTQHTGYVEKWPDYLEALVRAEPEKYNGLFTEEQLHAWGVEQGVVTEMQVLGQDDPRQGQMVADLKSSTRRFEGSAAAALRGDELFPEGVNDIAGWMMNNYRQAFLVHAGNLKDVAKYTLRMIAWWDTFDVKLPDDLIAQGIELPAALRDAHGFEDYRTLLNAIRSPKTAQEFEAQVAKFGGPAQALDLLKVANRKILLGGHRKHVTMLAEHLRTALKAYHESLGDTPGYPRPPPPSLAELLGDETDFHKNKLLMSLTTLAGAYGNLPTTLVKELNDDLASFIRDQEAGDPEEAPQAVYDADVRKYLMLALEEARKGAADLRTQSGGIRQITALRAQLDDAINQHLHDIAGVDFDSYILQVAKGAMKQKRLRLVWDESGRGWPQVAFVSEQWTPDDVATDLKRIHALAQDFGWSDETYAQRLRDYFAGDPPLAVAALRALDNLFDPSRMETRFIEFEDPDGKTVRLGIKPTRFLDPALNLGLVTFKMAIIGGDAFKKAWKIWGDLDETKNLAQALASSLLSEGRSQQEIAQAYSQALTSTINLLDYAEYISSRASKPALFDVAGETFTTLATMAKNPYPTAENVRDLTYAALKDLTLYVNPHLATVYLLHGVYNWASTRYVTWSAESDVVDFLVKNGEWDVPEGRQGSPRLTGIHLSRGGEDGTLVSNEAEGPPETLCRDESGADLIKPPVMRWLAKKLPTDWAEGIALRGKDSTRKVKPRDALLELFYAGPYEAQDPMLGILQEAIRNLPGDWWSWGYLLLWDTSKNWNKRWLKDLGIAAPTQEDSNRLAEGDVHLVAKATSDFLTWRGFLDNAGDGTKRNFGYLVSQYWVQRQILLEGPVICSAYKQAARKVLKEDVTTTEVDFLSQVLDLDRRMEALDRQVWPKIARSADRTPGATYEPNRDFPLRDEFRTTTRPMRDRLHEIEQLLGQRGGDEVVPLAPGQEGAATGGASSAPGSGEEFVLEPPSPESAGATAVTGETAEVPPQPELLTQEAQDILGKMTDLVYAYEDDYAAVLATLSGTDTFVAGNTKGESGSFQIAPYHVRLYYSGRRVSATATPEEVGEAINAGAPLPGTESTAESPLGTLDQAILNVQHLIDLGPGADAKKAADEWAQFYREEFETVRTDLGGVIEELLRNLRPMGSALDGAKEAADRLWGWLEYLNAVGPYELAEKHPYWNRLVRLRFQIRKLDNMIPTAGEATRDEIEAAVGKMVLKKDEKIELPAAGEVLTPFLRKLAGQMKEEYDRLLDLTRNMFLMTVSRASDERLAATDRVSLSVKNEPFADRGGPDAAEIKKLVKSYWWEIAPAGAGDLRDPDCLYLVRGDFWVDRKVKSWRLTNQPLRAAGKFAVRVTALGEADIPLAQVQHLLELEVEPAKLAGEIRFEGDWGPEIVSGFFGQRGKEPPQPRFQLIDSDVAEDGSFEKPLCYFYPEEFPDPPLEALTAGDAAPESATETGEAPAEPQEEAAAETAAPATTGAYPPLAFWAYAGVLQGTQLDPRSPAVDVTFHPQAHLHADADADADADAGPPSRAHFTLDEPLRLQATRMVSVTLDVRDASDSSVPADSFVVFKGEEIPWHGPLLLRIEPGEEISAVARRGTAAGQVEGKSRAVVYDPETLPEGEQDKLSLKVEMPFFDTGNLQVTGRFVPPEGSDPPVVIAEGSAWSNIANEKPVGQGGGIDFSNDKPIRLADKFTMEALLYADDGRFLRPSAQPIIYALAPARVLDLGDIAVEPFEVSVEPIDIAAVAWNRAPLPETGTRVFIGSDSAARAGDLYQGAAHFAKRDEEIKIKVEHDMPDGTTMEKEEILQAADLGDPLHPKPPDQPIEVKLLIYLPGHVLAKGKTLVDLPDGASPPDKVKITIKPPESPLTIEYEVRPGEDFELKVLETVRLIRLIEVDAEAEAGDIALSGRGAAAVPVEFGPDGIAVADLGTIELGSALGLVVVPDVRGSKLEAARATLREHHLKLVEAEGTAAKPSTPDEARVVYEQEKIGETVPSESSVVVKAYGESNLVQIPPVVGLSVDKAEGILGAAGFHVNKSALDPQRFEGQPGVVLAQIPKGWAEPGAEVVIGYLKGAEPEPEEVVPPPPTDEGGPPPVAVTGGGVEGPWVGQLRLTSLIVDGSPSTADQLFDRMLTRLVDDLKEEKKKREREERERAQREQQQAQQGGGSSVGDALAGLAQMPSAIGEGIAEGIGDALGMMMAVIILPYGKAGLDMLKEGVDVGFALQQEADGYRIVVPDMPPDQAEKTKPYASLLKTEDGRTFRADKVLDPNSGSKASLTIVMSEDLSSADVTLTASGRNAEPTDPRDIRSGSITLTGAFKPGRVTYQEIEDRIKQRLDPLVERAALRVMTRIKPYLEETE